MKGTVLTDLVVAGKSVGHERMVTSQVSDESLGLGSQLCTERIQEQAIVKRKKVLFGGDTHSADRMWAISGDERGLET